MTSSHPVQPLPIVILISGRGSNLQALIDDAQQPGAPVNIRAVISNRPHAYGLERAKRAGIPTEVLNHKDFTDRESYDRALQQLIDTYEPGLVVLAGFMRLLTADFVAHYRGRLINIHPSLLPAFKGLNTHERALSARVKHHGASVHFVTEEMDGGPVILQGWVPIHAADDTDTLAQRVLEQEHVIYPLVVRWFAEGRLRLENDTVWLDGEPLNSPKQMAYPNSPQ